LPLLIDMRHNGGGDGQYPAAVLSYLAHADANYPDRTESFRITYMTRQMVERWNLNPSSRADRAVPALVDALAERRPMTYEYTLTDGITADPDIGGFDRPVVALVSPFCGSACDIQSMLFKKSGRVTLVGTASNGTGAGYLTSG